MDGSTWKQISSASEVGSTVSAAQSFSFQNRAQTYTVPYTGEYEITLNGAQGGKYGQYTGGLGGRTTARVWLEKGETLSFRVGGQSGYPDGGKGTSYGNGGGSTSIFTARSWAPSCMQAVVAALRPVEMAGQAAAVQA